MVGAGLLPLEGDGGEDIREARVYLVNLIGGNLPRAAGDGAEGVHRQVEAIAGTLVKGGVDLIAGLGCLLYTSVSIVDLRLI